MKMSHEYVLDGEARAITHHLPLGSLAAVEKEGVPFALKGDRTHVATHGGARSSGAEECDSNHVLAKLVLWRVTPLKAVEGVQWAATRAIARVPGMPRP